MLAQRGFGIGGAAKIAQLKTRSDTSISSSPAPNRESRRRLSFKQKHALETLPPCCLCARKA
jgi:hypothetical protein